LGGEREDEEKEEGEEEEEEEDVGDGTEEDEDCATSLSSLSVSSADFSLSSLSVSCADSRRENKRNNPGKTQRAMTDVLTMNREKNDGKGKPSPSMSF